MEAYGLNAGLQMRVLAQYKGRIQVDGGVYIIFCLLIILESVEDDVKISVWEKDSSSKEKVRGLSC